MRSQFLYPLRDLTVFTFRFSVYNKYPNTFLCPVTAASNRYKTILTHYWS
ncbi:MAG: hypothetical protein HS115_00345 [Spirochaetales bacterium]|nr:hypothetical protein [Spirochaetales bacterium]